MANVLRSEFLGSALQSRTATSSKPAQRVQTQALFKKAEKSLKRETSKVAQKAKGAAGKAQKTAKKSAPSPLKKAQKAVSGSSKKTKGWLGGVGGAQGLKVVCEYLIQSDWCLDASPLSNWLRDADGSQVPLAHCSFQVAFSTLGRPQLPEWYSGWRVSISPSIHVP